jgi:hypothetical protein
MQLAKVIDLKKHLPDGLTKTIEALFDYRNFMFHNGFEWPKAQCEEFDEHIEKRDWQAWFSKATRGDAPWIFYIDGRIHRPLHRHQQIHHPLRFFNIRRHRRTSFFCWPSQSPGADKKKR